MPTISPKYLDRLIGMAVSVVGGVGLYHVHSWLTNMTFQEKEFPLHAFCGMTAPNSREYECFRNLNTKKQGSSGKIVHKGSCHCGKFHFRVLASDVINVVDYNTKIRFPRLTIRSDELEVINNASLSRYSVTDGSQSGIHSFCSSCGMQVMYTPSVTHCDENEDVVVNVDCLDRATVRQVNVSYGGKWNMFPSLVPLQLPDNLQTKDRRESCESIFSSGDERAFVNEMKDISSCDDVSTDFSCDVMDELLLNDDITDFFLAVDEATPTTSSIVQGGEKAPLFNTLSLLYDL